MAIFLGNLSIAAQMRRQHLTQIYSLGAVSRRNCAHGIGGEAPNRCDEFHHLQDAPEALTCFSGGAGHGVGVTHRMPGSPAYRQCHLGQRLASNSRSFCLNLLNAGITDTITPG